MDPITSQKARKRANRDLALVEKQIVDLRIERDTALAGYQHAEAFLSRQVDDPRAAINAYDAANPGRPAALPEAV